MFRETLLVTLLLVLHGCTTEAPSIAHGDLPAVYQRFVSAKSTLREVISSKSIEFARVQDGEPLTPHDLYFRDRIDDESTTVRARGLRVVAIDDDIAVGIGTVLCNNEDSPGEKRERRRFVVLSRDSRGRWSVERDVPATTQMLEVMNSSMSSGVSADIVLRRENYIKYLSARPTRVGGPQVLEGYFVGRSPSGEILVSPIAPVGPSAIRLRWKRTLDDFRLLALSHDSAVAWARTSGSWDVIGFDGGMMSFAQKPEVNDVIVLLRVDDSAGWQPVDEVAIR